MRRDPYSETDLAIAVEINKAVSRESTQERRIQRQRELTDDAPEGVIQAYLDLITDSPCLARAEARWAARRKEAGES